MLFLNSAAIIFYGTSGIIVGEDFDGIAASGSHGIGAQLAHAHAVPAAHDFKTEFSVDEGHGVRCGRQLQGVAQIHAVQYFTVNGNGLDSAQIVIGIAYPIPIKMSRRTTKRQEQL